MRSQPLTAATKPGGRPRKSRAPRNAFADWLATQKLTPKEIAKALGTSVSTIYNARNGYFSPARDLAVKIEEYTKGSVTVESWGEAKTRPRNRKS